MWYTTLFGAIYCNILKNTDICDTGYTAVSVAEGFLGLISKFYHIFWWLVTTGYPKELFPNKGRESKIHNFSKNFGDHFVVLNASINDMKHVLIERGGHI